MAADKTKVFVSFDPDNQEPLKELLVSQSLEPDSPFEVVAQSSTEPRSLPEWERQTYEAIAGCDAFVVLLGPTTRQVSAVVREAQMADELCAKGRLDRCAQLIGHDGGSEDWALPQGGPVYRWDWSTLKEILASSS